MAWIVKTGFQTSRILGGTLAVLTGAGVLALTLHTSDPTGTYGAGNEVTGVNYTAGGIDLTGVTVTEDAGVKVTFDAASGAAQFKYLMDAGGFANATHAAIRIKGTGQVICTYAFAAAENNTTHDLELDFDAAGIFAT